MDSSSVLSDDDYDLISNPSQRSLESSLADLRLSSTYEPPALSAALQKFETIKWTAGDIQTYIGKSLDASISRLAPNGPQAKNFENRTARVFVDGSFDAFNVGHVLQLRQAKLSFPFVYLMVGVFSDELLDRHGQTASWDEVERAEMLRHCRWVDEVIPDAPWVITEEFVHQRRIDFIAIDEGTTVDPACDKLRVNGYDEMKRIGRIIATKRTTGLSANVPRTAITAPPTPTVLTVETPAPDFTTHIQDYGLDS
ncbi:hypothetical protein BDQ12DRAFT_681585 [Crucibulum laeve]|uniref:choline-phosphate cytidylyltransferase n=1 Tax=Crucibulum laeve TaxID=68775 RepID=A0A5C3M433_9AGAR|nr:hypothetical protein BDQ12DRAFT_681585 [Crucibulum laeve]